MQYKWGSFGSPILLLNDFKVIGIHFGSSKRSKFNLGTFLTYPLIELNKKKSRVSNFILKENEKNMIKNSDKDNLNKFKEIKNYDEKKLIK